LISFVEDRKGHDFRYALNSSKIKKFNEWQPNFDYLKSLETTVVWYKSWYETFGEVYS
jgi:dTDP-glucose 4,6-dehydratase